MLSYPPTPCGIYIPQLVGGPLIARETISHSVTVPYSTLIGLGVDHPSAPRVSLFNTASARSNTMPPKRKEMWNRGVPAHYHSLHHADSPNCNTVALTAAIGG